MAFGGGFDLGTAYGRVVLDASGADATIANLQNRLVNGLQQAGGALTGVGGAITAATAPLLLFGKRGVSVAGDFEAAMLEIQARTGSTADEMEAMRQVAIQMGADTVFGANDAAESLLQLLTSGLSVNEALAVLPEVMNGAAASGENLGNVADWTTDIMAAYGLEADKAGNVIDALTRAAGSGSATFGDLARGFQNVGGMASIMGLEVDETAAILQIFSENGIKGAEAGTQLRSMLNNLTSTTAKGALDELNVSLYDLDGNMRGMDDIIDDLNAAMDGMTDEQRIDYIKRLAGAYGQQGLAALLGAEGTDAMMQAMQGAADAASVAETRMQGWKGATENLSGSIETFMIEVLTPFMENTLTPLANKTAEVVNKVTAWAKENPELMASVLRVILALGILGPILVIVGQGLNLAAGAVKGLSIVLGIMTSPLGLVVAGITALALALGWLANKNILGIGDFFKNLGGIFRNIIVDVAGIASSMFTIANSVIRLLGSLLGFDAAESGVQGFFDTITSGLHDFSLRLDGFRQLVDAFATFMNLLSQPTIDHAAFADMLIELDKVAQNPLVQLLLGRTDLTGKDLLDEFTRIRTSIIDTFTGAWDAVRPSLEALQGWFTTTGMPAIRDMVNNQVMPRVDEFFGVLSGAWSKIEPQLTPLVEWFTTTGLPSILTFIADTALNTITGFIGLFATIWDVVNVPLSNLVNWFTTEGLPGAISFVTDTVIPGIERFRNIMRGIWLAVQPHLNNLKRWFDETGMPAIETAIDAVTGAWNTVRDTMQAIWNAVREPLQNFANRVQDVLRPVTDFIGGIATKIGEVIAGLEELGRTGGRPEGAKPGDPNSFLIPGMASGGPVRSNFPYLVGEEGPELFLPGSSGTIIPNDALGSFGGGRTYNFNIAPGAIALAPISGMTPGEQAVNFLDALEDEINRRG